MLIIQSFFKNSNTIRGNLKLAAKQANLSCKFLKKYGYDVILYTDEHCRKYFSKIKYDNIITLDNDLIQTNHIDRFYSISKLLACLSTKDPYLHIDIDFFLLEDILRKHLDTNFITFHKEPWVMKWFFNRISEHEIKKHLNLIKQNTNVYNCCIFGGNDILTINSSIDKVLQHSLKINNYINNMMSIFTAAEQQTWVKSVFIEQYYLTNTIYKITQNPESVVLNLPEEYNTITNAKKLYKIFKQEKIFHIWIAKRSINKIIGLNHYLDMMEKYYF